VDLHPGQVIGDDSRIVRPPSKPFGGEHSAEVSSERHALGGVDGRHAEL